MKYHCIVCKQFGIRIEKEWLEEAKQDNLPYIPVFCEACGHACHSDDTIENHKVYVAKRKLERMEQGTRH